MFFDEFAVYDRPSLFYGWAERNTRPEVKSDERTRNKLNGLLCIDTLSGEEFFRLSPGSKTEDISEYLAELCLDSVELGYTKLCIILDNNPTHKRKMQAQERGASPADGTSKSARSGIFLCPLLFSKAESRRVCDSLVAIEISPSSPSGHNAESDCTTVRAVSCVQSVSLGRTGAENAQFHLLTCCLIFWWEGSR